MVLAGLATTFRRSNSSPRSSVSLAVSSFSGVERLVSELLAREGEAERLEEDITALHY